MGGENMQESPRGEGAGYAPGAGLVHDRAAALAGSRGVMGPHAGDIGLRLRAEVKQLSMLRAVAETVLLTADFTIDVVTDVRVALDEVATAMMLSTVPGGAIECEFRCDDTQVHVRVAGVVTTDDAFDEHSFSRQILASLTDSLRTSRAPFDPELRGYPLVVRFSRLRSPDRGR